MIRFRQHRYSFFVLLILLVPCGVWAQDDGAAVADEKDEEVETITVRASYDPLDPRTVPSQVTVITRDQIVAAAPRDVADIIEPLVGVKVDRYGGPMQQSSVSIRGSGPEQVLVLVNGKRLNTAQTGTVDLSMIRTEEIERIEVIRGGAAARYGEGAFGGVINIVTRRGGPGDGGTAGDKTGGAGTGLGFEAEYGIASFNTHHLNLAVGGPLDDDERLTGRISAGGRYTDGNFSFPDEQAESGESQRKNADGISGSAAGSLDWLISPAQKLSLGLRGSVHADSKGVPGLEEFPSVDARMSDRLYQGMASLEWGDNPVANTTVDLAFLRRERYYEDPEYFLGGIDEAHKNTALSADMELARADDFRPVFPLILRPNLSYGYRLDMLDSSSLEFGGGQAGEGLVYRSRHGISASAEMHLFPYEEKDWGRLALFPALRFDLAETRFDAGEFYRMDYDLSWQTGAMVPLDSQRKWQLKGTVGTTYRLPTFDDLFWPSGAFAAGNPSLLPEKAFFWDAGVLAQPADWITVEAAYFHRNVEDLIQWNPDPTGRWTPSNLGSALIQGAEAEVKLLFMLMPLSGFIETRGNYTFLNPVNTTEGTAGSGKILPRRPQEKASASAVYTHFDGHSLRLEGRYVGFRFVTAANTKYLPAYFVLDMSGRLAIGKTVTVEAFIRNILDERYTDLREYPVPGREIGASVEVKL